MESKSNDIQNAIIDAIIDQPLGFRIDNKQFYIYPPSLGMSYVIMQSVARLGINRNIVALNPFAESLRLAHDNREACLRLIALATIRRKRDIFDEAVIENRINELSELDIDTIATLISFIMSNDDTEKFIRHLGLDEEQKNMAVANQAKGDNNTFIFCGKSVYGSLIEPACEKYGWTYDYVVWGISFVNLQLLMADAVKTVYLSDEEKKHVHLVGHYANENVINADDPANVDKILSMNWD